MKSKRKNVVFSVLAILVGLPVVLLVAVVSWVSIADKTNGMIVSSGRTRRYRLYVPKTYAPSKPTPLVISLHPALWPAAQAEISGWNELADENGFIVVYPVGSNVPRVWKMGQGAGAGRDIRFISDLIDALETTYNIDRTRIYADGMSIGGGMAFALSCKMSDRMAAVGVVAGAQMLPWEECLNSKPMPMIAFHGTADRVAPYRGGKSPVAPWYLFPDIRDWTAHIAQRNQCQGDPTDTKVTDNVRCLAYTNCAKNAGVILYIVEGGGHSWPGGKDLPQWLVGPTTHEINATRLMWEFFVLHPRGPK